MGFYIPTKALPGLKQYKYSSEDHSIISKYVLSHFWNKFVLLLPQSMAPNLVTLTGLGFVIANFITLLIYNPTFDKVLPSWIYYSWGAGLFLYQTFDAVDGKQARRTGQSGPLGELFDHSCDAINTTLGVLLFAACVNLQNPWYIIISQFATLTNFYLSTWEEYHTGTLYLSEFSGPVEGVLMIVACFLYTGYAGPEVFHSNIWKLLSIEPALVSRKLLSYGVETKNADWLAHFTLNEANLVFGAGGLLFNIVGACANVIKHSKKSDSSAVPLLRTVPFVLFYSSVFAYAYSVPACTENLITFCLMVACCFAYNVGEMITAHVSKQRFPLVNVLQFFPSVGILLHYYGRQYVDPDLTDAITLKVLLLLSAGVYAFFLTDVITSITEYLDIGCLYIKHPKQA